MPAKEEVKKQHPHLLFDSTFHDLKPKGISDLEGAVEAGFCYAAGISRWEVHNKKQA